ncbi:uncharacterized protein FFB20_07049 [Fusarium fujikuroi]|nr:uncharacterized protein FFB20_07049 [Fusarium fujikuroi]SCO16833.1 uncharacterized protein FFC1_12972 [Fusarium fujikuroi]SCV59640.1 uncharacterized protein FFFS_14209 [Fusarium fujikuroi]
MTYLTCGYGSDTSSISDGDIDTPLTLDVVGKKTLPAVLIELMKDDKELNVNDILSLSISETEESLGTSALHSQPSTPLNHSLLTTQREWEGLCTKYDQGIQNLRDIEDQMLRYQALHPCLSISHGNPMLYTQCHHMVKDRDTNNIHRTVDSLGGQDGDAGKCCSQGHHHHLKVQLDNAVEVSIVTLDTLTGKKTMISLTTKSTIKHVQQLLGFWEYDLPMSLQDGITS